jgi:hypothetical protein
MQADALLPVKQGAGRKARIRQPDQRRDKKQEQATDYACQ